MHSALFIAHPQDDDPNWDAFLEFVDARLAPSKGVTRLAANVWLVNFHHSPEAFGWLLASANHQKVSYGFLQFEHPPQWLPVGFDPTSFQDKAA
ncbi:MAG TPA: hypothetical protein VMU31_09820 [Rhizomicrobium sp.]|nr:hypothetical protein [Rhizomicrobium sp.]